MKQILQETERVLGAGDWRIIGGLVRDYVAYVQEHGHEPNWEPSPEHDVDVVWDIDEATLDRIGAINLEPSQAAPVRLLKTKKLGTIQIANPREEEKKAPGANGFSYQKATYLRDARRREAHINAIAMDAQGNLHDYFNGQDFIKSRIYQHIDDDKFIEDPVRWLRACRFEAKGYTIAPETICLMRTDAFQKELEALIPERIFVEMMKGLKEEYPSRFFRAILRIGIGKQYFPEIFAMTEMPAGPAEYHPEGTLFEHCCIVLDEVAKFTKNPETRLAAFLHDLGKLRTEEDKRPHYYEHDKHGVEAVEEFLLRFKPTSHMVKTAKAISLLHMNAARWKEMRIGSKLDLAKRAVSSGVESILPIIVKADTSMRPEEAVLMDDFDLACQIAATGAKSFIGDKAAAFDQKISQAGKQLSTLKKEKAPQLEIEKAEASYKKALQDFQGLISGERARRFRELRSR